LFLIYNYSPIRYFSLFHFILFPHSFLPFLTSFLLSFYNYFLLLSFFFLCLISLSLFLYCFICAFSPVVFSFSCRVLLRTYLFFLVPSSLYSLFKALTCTLFVVTFRRVIITKIENRYLVLIKEIQILILNNRISASYCVRLTAMGGQFD